MSLCLCLCASENQPLTMVAVKGNSVNTREDFCQMHALRVCVPCSLYLRANLSEYRFPANTYVTHCMLPAAIMGCTSKYCVAVQGVDAISFKKPCATSYTTSPPNHHRNHILVSVINMIVITVWGSSYPFIAVKLSKRLSNSNTHTSTTMPFTRL